MEGLMMMKTEKKNRRNVYNLLVEEEKEPNSNEGILQIVLSDIAIEEVQNLKKANRTYMEWIGSMNLIDCGVKYASQS